MWRNSLSLYSRLVLSRNPNPNPAFLASSSISSLDAFIRPFSIASDGARALGSTVNTTSLSAGAALDLANHYGRCYWELSKARLRLGFSIQAFFFWKQNSLFWIVELRILIPELGCFGFSAWNQSCSFSREKNFGFNKFSKRIIVFFWLVKLMKICLCYFMLFCDFCLWSETKFSVLLIMLKIGDPHNIIFSPLPNFLETMKKILKKREIFLLRTFLEIMAFF